MEIKIRQEQKKDWPAVYQLIKEAFAKAEHRDGTEQDLVEELRQGEGFVPQLSLVAEADGCLAGHVMFTRARVGADEVLVLAPLSVLPRFWRQGVGTALVRQGHQIAGQMGFSYCLVLGSRDYYPRFGYLPAQKLGIQAPDGIPEEYLMAARLRPDAKAISGTVVYAKEFGI